MNVGEVVKVERMDGDSDIVKVTMEMKEEGLPIHKDATAKIRSRIFLEGNFFVELSPGTPNGDKLDDGDTIPVTQTSTPVQLDQLLTALQTQRPRVAAGPADRPRRRAHAQAERGRRRRPGS